MSWTYDKYGNRLNQTQTAGSPPTNSLSFASPSGGALTNHPDNMCFDLNGNLMTETPSNPCPPASPTYSYDAENRLVSYMGTGGTYTYDGTGLRVKKAAGGTTTVYIFSGNRVIAEYDNGAAVGSPSCEYIYSGAQRIAMVQGSTTTYLHPDHLSVRVSTDSNGTNARSFGHYPFGELWYETGTASKWKFTTYERDSESTNDYAMARYHVNRFGRFLTTDPLSGDTADPQSLNRYAYAVNDPTDLTDPSGECYMSGYTGPYCNSQAYDPSMGASSTCYGCENINFAAMYGQISRTQEQEAEYLASIPWYVVKDGHLYRYGHTVWTTKCDPNNPDAPCTISGTVTLIDLGALSTGGGNSSWAWTFTKNFVSNFFSPSFYKQELQQGGCLNTFVHATGDALNPVSPSLSSGGDAVAAAYAASKFNAALTYAASRPNYLGGQGLLYPLKSGTFRAMLSDAKVASVSGVAVSVDLALLQGLIVEGYQAYKGNCR